MIKQIGHLIPYAIIYAIISQLISFESSITVLGWLILTKLTMIEDKHKKDSDKDGWLL